MNSNNNNNPFDQFHHSQYKHVPFRAAAAAIRLAQGPSINPLTEFSNEGYVDAPFPLPPRRGSQLESSENLSQGAVLLQRCWDLT